MKASNSTLPLTMDPMRQQPIKPLVPALAVVLTLSGFALFLLIGNPFAQTVTPIDQEVLPLELPGVTWEPETLVVTMSSGETKTVTVTATSDGTVPATTVQLSPELQPYVTVTPTQLPKFNGVSQQSLDLVFDVPAETDYQEITGSLVLKGPKVSVENRLSITFRVWPTAESPVSLVKLKYPPDWRPAPLHDIPNEPTTISYGPPSEHGGLIPQGAAVISVFLEATSNPTTILKTTSGVIDCDDTGQVVISSISVGGIPATRADDILDLGTTDVYTRSMVSVPLSVGTLKLTLVFNCGDPLSQQFMDDFNATLQAVAIDPSLK